MRQMNYSALRENYILRVREVLSLRPYIEATHFMVRADHRSLEWMMTPSDQQGLLMRWRFCLMELDYDILDRPSVVH